MEKNEEEFAPYLERFATAIWGLLMQVGLAPSKDALATESIRFLTTLVSGVHHTLFQARRPVSGAPAPARAPSDARFLLRTRTLSRTSART